MVSDEVLINLRALSSVLAENVQGYEAIKNHLFRNQNISFALAEENYEDHT